MHGSELCACNVMSNRQIANAFVLWAGRSSMWDLRWKRFLCHQAVDKLCEQFELGQERLFNPLNVRDNAGLDDLVGDPLTRKHMEN